MNPSCYFNFKRYINKAYTDNKAYADEITNKEWWESPFPCEYEILDNRIIEAKIDCSYFGYELKPTAFDTEGNPSPHIKVCGTSPYKKRDFLIFDNGKYFLLKNAKVDTDGFTMVCRAKEYFISYNVDKNRMFKFFEEIEEIKVKSIKIFAKTLNKFKNTDIFFKESVNINKNNISKISVQIGNSPDSPNEFSVYIQIDLDEAVDPYKAYDDVGTDKVYDYLEEIAIYFQLFYPSKIKIDHVYTILEDVDQEVDTIIDDVRHEVKIIEDDNCFEFVTVDLQNFYDRVAMFNKSSLSAFSPTITGNILDFLKTCYDKIAYRTCDNYLRDIKHFIFEPSLLIENWFLCCFKFIETFYRSLSNKHEIIKKAIEEYYKAIKKYDGNPNKEYDGDQNKEDIFLCCFEFIEKFYKDLKKNYTLIKRTIEEYYYEKDNEPYGHKIIENATKKYNEPYGHKIIENATKKYGNYADCIVKLRNHYSHGGYYLPENFNDSKKISELDVYNDFLRVLQRIAVNIIFKSILGYESHKFPMLAEF